ncbi:MAG: elongation factor [Aliidongia sp.]|jgi:elongation factor G|nr:elongation factor [Aliidongia sp.]
MSASSSPTENRLSPGRAARPRSVALVGPYGSGKSTLYESLMAAAGAPVRRAGEQRARAMTTEMTLGHCEYLGDRWSLVDCPGSIEFAAETAAALSIVDLAIIVCEPVPERALTLAPLFKILEDRAIPHLVFINKIDTLQIRVRDTLAALQAYSRRPLVLRQVPIREQNAVTGYVDVVSERAYRYRKGQESELIQLPSALQQREEEALGSLIEVLADHDDGILEKVLEDVKPSTEEVYRQLRADQASDAIVEVLLGSADRGGGVRRLWKALRHDGPDPLATAARRGVEPSGEALVQIFKTVHAAHTGKLSYGRVWRGTVKDATSLGGVRIGGLYRMPGSEAVRITETEPGDLVALSRLDGIATGDVLTAAGVGTPLPFPPAPPPVFSLAVATIDRKDDVKLSSALQKLCEEDLSLSVEHSPLTGETLLHGQGEIHLHAIIDRLARIYALKLSSTRPLVPFKETIRRPIHQHARLKRQTGGHGQFADVKIEIEPRGRGEGFLFTDRIVGGAVPRQYIPAVAEAAEEATRKGPFGYPVVDIGVTLTDGTFHAVDSSDMAFKGATRIAMTEGLAKAEPVLLEPIDHVTISVPNDFTAGAQRLLSGRRGQILGYAEKPDWPGWDAVEALVPAAELHELITELRSQTMGIGSYVRRFDHLAEARGKLAEKVAAEAGS